MKILAAWFQHMTQTDTRFYRSGKKAIFACLFLALLSNFFPTVHNRDLIDRIWSNLYWLGPLAALLAFFFMMAKARSDLRKFPPS